MSCLENVQIPSCVWFEGGEKRNALMSMLAGTLVSLYDISRLHYIAWLSNEKISFVVLHWLVVHHRCSRQISYGNVQCLSPMRCFWYDFSLYVSIAKFYPLCCSLSQSINWIYQVVYSLSQGELCDQRTDQR